jgi:putative addiction module component (TIGR02574 family)
MEKSEKHYKQLSPEERATIMNTQILQQASVLDIDEQIELVEAIWDGIVSRGAAPSLTEAQKTELDRRLEDHLKNPDNVVSWSELKVAALAKIRQ